MVRLSLSSHCQSSPRWELRLSNSNIAFFHFILCIFMNTLGLKEFAYLCSNHCTLTVTMSRKREKAKGVLYLLVWQNAIFCKIIFLVFSPLQKFIYHVIVNLETNDKMENDQNYVGNNNYPFISDLLTMFFCIK